MKTAKNREEAEKIFTKPDSAPTFIQWKGTDICMDLDCECGEHNHYNGYFAYTVKCSSCGAVYALSDKIEVVKLTDHDQEEHSLESE